jgi:UDP-glucose 4-epimerase
MRILLFGANGFLGRHILVALREGGCDVVPFGTSRSERISMALDISDAAEFAPFEMNADVLVNLAARVPKSGDSSPPVAHMMSVNASGAAHVADFAARCGAKRVIYASTLSVVARPWPVPLTEQAPTYPLGSAAAYAASKLAGELVSASIAEKHGMSHASLRFSALYGVGMPWFGVLPTFIAQATSGEVLRAARATCADFLHVDFAADAVARAATSDCSGVFNVASGMETSIMDLAAMVLRLSKRSTRDIQTIESPESRAIVDISKAKKAFGYTAQESREYGIPELIAAYQRQGKCA